MPKWLPLVGSFFPQISSIRSTRYINLDSSTCPFMSLFLDFGTFGLDAIDTRWEYGLIWNTSNDKQQFVLSFSTIDIATSLAIYSMPASLWDWIGCLSLLRDIAKWRDIGTLWSFVRDFCTKKLCWPKRQISPIRLYVCWVRTSDIWGKNDPTKGSHFGISPKCF